MGKFGIEGVVTETYINYPYVASLYINQCDIEIFQMYSFIHIHISTGRLYFDI